MKSLFVYLTLLVLLVACSGNTTTEANQTGSDTAQENAAENSAVQNPEKQGSDAEDEFNAFFTKRNLQWKIAYDLKSEAEGEQMTSQMTQYIKGEDRFRTDVSYEGTESRTYMVDETFTMCTKQDGDWSCFKTSPQEGEESADVQEWEEEYEEDAAKYAITADGTKVVAGVTAKCFKVTETGDDMLVRYCFSSDGAPLYIYSSGGGAVTEMIATSYSKSVSDNDFVPPAEAQDIGAMYGGAGGTSPQGDDACAYCDYLSGEDKQNCLASC